MTAFPAWATVHRGSTLHQADQRTVRSTGSAPDARSLSRSTVAHSRRRREGRGLRPLDEVRCAGWSHSLEVGRFTRSAVS